MAGKAGKVWSLPRFWVPIRSYKKQLVKKFWGRILDLAWLKFAVAALCGTHWATLRQPCGTIEFLINNNKTSSPMLHLTYCCWKLMSVGGGWSILELCEDRHHLYASVVLLLLKLAFAG